jgi:protein phosphatase
MDCIALIADIHGNVPALEAVLDDIRRRGITRIFCLGDLVGKAQSLPRPLTRVEPPAKRW